MIRLLPFILIPILVVALLGYWRYASTKPSLESPETVKNNGPIEVPKTLPGATIEDRIEVNVPSPTPTTDSSLDLRLKSAEAAVTELKARVSSLENATPAQSQTTSSKSTVYIPLGSSGQISNTSDWVSLSTFQAAVDPSQYPGYTSMQLEVNMRLNQPGGTLYARLYSNGSIDSSQVSTTSTPSTLITSSKFTLSGSKTYTLQAKSSEGTQAFLDTARIKVNF